MHLARPHRPLRRVLTPLVAALIAVGVVAQPAPASAITTFPDTDQVHAFTSGSGMSGSITWWNYRRATGTIRVYNDMTDHQATVFRWRLKINGTWRAWSPSTIVGYSPSYPVPISISSSVNIQMVQFQIYEAQTGATISDYNQPLGY